MVPSMHSMSGASRPMAENAALRPFDNHAEQAFGTTEDAEQIEAVAALRLAAEAHARAVRQREFHAEQVVCGDAVFQAVQPAGILGDVAADGAGDLAGRIRRIVE